MARDGGDKATETDDDAPALTDAGLTELLLNELLGLSSSDELRSLLAARPELTGALVLRQLRNLAAAPGYGAGFERLLGLLNSARSDVAGAWAEYERQMREATAEGDALAAEEAAVGEALDRGDTELVLQLSEPAIERAMAAGLGMAASMLHELRGLALLRRQSPERAAELEHAIAELEAARVLAPPGAPLASVLMHLGFAYSERLRGDRADNTDAAVDLLRLAVEEVAGAGDQDFAAMVDTNLAFALMRRVRGDRTENLRDAVEACERALSHRSLDRNPVDWAYSQLNLGDALDQLDIASGADGHVEVAQKPYEAVIRAADVIPEPWLVGLGYQGLGRLYLRTAQTPIDAVVDAAAEGDELPPEVDEEALSAARVYFERATALLSDAPDKLQYGRALANHAEVLTHLDEVDAAIDAGRRALTVLRPTNAPQACLDVAGQLGTHLSGQGLWDEAAAVFSDAVAAADLAFYAQLDRASGNVEQRRAGNVYRWAAYALGQAKHVEAAVLTLESGRAREIRRRIDSRRDDPRLAGLPDELRDAYVAAAIQLGGGPLGDDAAAASRAFAEVVSAIRELPGYESFGAGARLDDVAAAAEPGWPVVYVNPTPFGTLLLAVTADDEVSISSSFVDGVTSTDVIARLLLGAAATAGEGGATEVEPHPYLLGVDGGDDAHYDFAEAVDELLPWLGETIARPLCRLLTETSAAGCTLIVCGPLALAPLHAASWHAEETSRCLLDYLAVRYAPAATVASACLARAATLDASQPTLVGVANPTHDLPASEAELVEITSLFADGHADCAIGASADRQFLQERAGPATFVHLACHAHAPLFTSDPPFILLADGPLSASLIAGIAQLEARLVTVSACQSAVSRLDDLPEEAISLGTTMLIAGGACAIATLWPVYDVATAMLMTRLYEEILGNGQSPPAALRRAQLWLRDLTEPAEADFLAKHPALDAEVRRRAERGELRGRRGAVEPVDAARRSPYAHPEYWAAFVAVGA